MAQVLLLKIGTGSQPQEHSSSGDDITFGSFAVTGGGPVMNSSGLDMNNQDIVDLNEVQFNSNLGSVNFKVATDTAAELDQLIIPRIAGTPTAAPTNGEGSLIWDSTNNILYIWDGAVWSNSFVVISEAVTVTDLFNVVADTGGVAANDCVYISSSGKVKPAKGDAEATARAVGFSKASALASASVKLVQDGIMDGFSGLTAGSRYFLSSATAGAITLTAPTGVGHEIVKVGYALTATKLKIAFQHLGIRA